MSNPRVTVVIPNWNGLAHLEECFASLRGQTFREFVVVMIDNASSDASVPWLKEHEPGVELVVMPRNGGFSYAVNEGIRRARTEYVALLNNDTAVAPGWLSALVEALDRAPDYDFAASRMVFFDEPERINAAGDVFQLTHLAACNRGYRSRAAAFGHTARVFGACAGAAIYRRRLFDDLGLFDEEFFLLSEDTDFNLRALIAGKKCLYVPDAVVRHKVGATIRSQTRSRMLRLAWRNQMVAVTKNLPPALLPLVVALWPLRTVRGILRPRAWRSVPENIRLLPLRIVADIDGFRMGLRKRVRAHRGSDTISTFALLRWLVVGTGRA